MSRAPLPIVHGTYGGYQTHLRRRTEACEACRKALADYQKDYRAKNQQQHRVQVELAKARDRALRVLAQKHPTEFAQLYKLERNRKKKKEVT